MHLITPAAYFPKRLAPNLELGGGGRERRERSTMHTFTYASTSTLNSRKRYCPQITNSNFSQKIKLPLSCKRKRET